MRAAAYPIVPGCLFLLGAAPLPAVAAEWSINPTYSWSVDHDSNRTLDESPVGSEATVLTADLRFRRALEDTTLVIEPKYSLRRFSDAHLGNGDDRSLATAWDRVWERSHLSLSASVFDQSTLTTELLETGILQADLHQNLIQGGGDWNWSLSERRQLFTQVSYADVSYHGGGAVNTLLPGYRYPSASLGERFVFSATGTVSVSAFGSSLQSDTAGNSSREAGLQVELTYAFSEHGRFDGSLGRSQRTLAGQRSQGTTIALSVTRELPLGSMSLAYTRNLVPYGVGFLVERQLLTIAGSRQLTPYLDATLSLIRARNDELSVLLNIDRRSLDSAVAGLNWRPAETWSLGLQLAATRTQGPGFFGSAERVNEWRSAFVLTWNPHPRMRSW